MFSLLLISQLVPALSAFSQPQQLKQQLPPADSTYSSPALRAFVEEAAVRNRVPPPALKAYHARIESELSLLLRDTLGRERVAQVEQIAMTAEWQRGQRYDLRVVGYRSQTVGVPYSAMSFARSWTVPYLYGDRLTLGVEMSRAQAKAREPSDSATSPADSASTEQQPSRSEIRAIHPLARDRDRFYRFSGGDTIATLHVHGRRIFIVRVHVTPHLDSVSSKRWGAFEGELDLDAERRQIVRMRGQIVTSRGAGRGARSALARLPGVIGVAFIEFVNAESGGAYWLPSFQRTEFQASFAPLGQARSIFRLVSRFDDMQVSADATDATLMQLSAVPTRDSAVVQAARDSVGGRLAEGGETSLTYRRRLTQAPADSVSRFDRWREQLGSETGRVTADDFADLAPDIWRDVGAPRVDLWPAKFDDVFRFNRIEGAYTGLGASVRFRDAMPGLAARVFGGWAWSQSTLRGGVTLSLNRAHWISSLRAERTLANTNDFVPPFEEGIGLAALLSGLDDRDYLDRRLLTLGVTRVIGSVEEALISAEVGVASDRSERTRLERGLFGGSMFRSNRLADEGRYLKTGLRMEYHPNVTGVFLQPGIGALVSYEAAAGDLDWQRGEITLSARRHWRDIVFASRVQGGVVFGHHPAPQAMFELGNEGALPGYGYKEFGGDRAAGAGALASYTFPVLRRPWRLVRSLMVPGLSPGLAVGAQGGWAEISSPGARQAMQRLDPRFPLLCDLPGQPCPPLPLLSRPTDGLRATVDARVTFFGGMIGIGVARPVDRAAPWRMVFRAGQDF